MKKPTCETCPYFDAPLEMDTSTEGWCRKLHPAIGRVKAPLMSKYDFCGEHPQFGVYVEYTKLLRAHFKKLDVALTDEEFTKMDEEYKVG